MHNNTNEKKISDQPTSIQDSVSVNRTSLKETKQNLPLILVCIQEHRQSCFMTAFYSISCFNYFFYCDYCLLLELLMTQKCNVFLFCLWSLNIMFWIGFIILKSFCLFCRWKDNPTKKPFGLVSVLVLYAYYSVGSPKPLVFFSMIRNILNSGSVFGFFFWCLDFKPFCFSLGSLLLEQVVYTSQSEIFCISFWDKISVIHRWTFAKARGADRRS